MLECFDHIQYILLARVPAITDDTNFCRFGLLVAGRAWLAAILETVQSVAKARASVEKTTDG